MTVIRTHPFKVGDRVSMTDFKPTGYNGKASRVGSVGTVTAITDRLRDGYFWLGIRWDFSPNVEEECEWAWIAERFELVDSVVKPVRQVVDTAIREVLEAPVSLDNLADTLVESVSQALNQQFNLK